MEKMKPENIKTKEKQPSSSLKIRSRTVKDSGFLIIGACPGHFAPEEIDRSPVVIGEDVLKKIAEETAKLKAEGLSEIRVKLALPLSGSWEINHKLIEEITEQLTSKEIPLTLTLSSDVPDDFFSLLNNSRCDEVEICFFSMSESLRENLIPQSIKAERVFELISLIKPLDVKPYLRIDPVIPFINDDLKDLEKAVELAKKSGACGIRISTLKISPAGESEVIEKLSGINVSFRDNYQETFSERLDEDIVTDYEYRHRLFSMIKAICLEAGMPLYLLDEYIAEKRRKGPVKYVDLNLYYELKEKNILTNKKGGSEEPPVK